MMMTVRFEVYVDCETYGGDLLRQGVYRYFEEANVSLIGFRDLDGTVKLIDFIAGQTQHLPRLRELVNDPAIGFVAHNAQFDRLALARAGLPVSIERWRCTMVKALLHGLPGGLDANCRLFSLPVKPIINRRFFSIPDAAHEDWPRFREYLRHDVNTLYRLDQGLPSYNEKRQLPLWHLDQRINDRGLRIDTALMEQARRAIEWASQQFKEVLPEGLNSTRQVAATLAMLKTLGLSLPDLRRATVERALNEESLDDAVQSLLRTRLGESRASTAKYDRIADMVCRDGRLHGALQFCGAPRTGRWAGRGFQPQNLPRPTMPMHEALSTLYEFDKFPPRRVVDAAATALRGLIVPNGNRLITSDFAQIEARVLPWLAGHEALLDVFRSGKDIYTETAAQLNADRFIGKVATLALGYGGGFKAFKMMAGLYGVDIPEQTARDVVEKWRAANQPIVQAWHRLEKAVRRALVTGRPQESGRLRVGIKNGFLWIGLPSGRFLGYPGIQVDTEDRLTFIGRNSLSETTWGGKLIENVVQALSRDVMAEKLLLLEQKCDIVLTVHDEILCEGDEQDVDSVMNSPVSWAEGLPVAAVTKNLRRYEKT